ncbi:hypothetical protein J8273_7414 [Carpediemonas membranifera]|uniref:Zinc finger C3HC4 RING-type domain-containing protein n=1 Tax=Carpediemonas membranifera TaxID=201153 RepID=A0A8J6ATK1_9EUKA|nr:hypothetical protein J8273_7414 [Carpediemonas membranifera]|eukprot:KAG9391140.1 hypothetical protein J8273_7414 [Carpediemonas membranifera]
MSTLRYLHSHRHQPESAMDDPWYHYYTYQRDEEEPDPLSFAVISRDVNFTAFAAYKHDFFACGTSTGDIHVFDPNGKRIELLPIARFHAGPVSHMALTEHFSFSSSGSRIVISPITRELQKVFPSMAIGTNREVTAVAGQEVDKQWVFHAGNVMGGVAVYRPSRGGYTTTEVVASEHVRCPVHCIGLPANHVLAVSDRGISLVQRGNNGTYTLVGFKDPVIGTMPYDDGRARLSVLGNEALVGWGHVVGVYSITSEDKTKLKPLKFMNVGAPVVGVSHSRRGRLTLLCRSATGLTVRVMDYTGQEGATDLHADGLRRNVADEGALDLYGFPTGRDRKEMTFFIADPANPIHVVPMSVRDLALHYRDSGRIQDALRQAFAAQDPALTAQLGVAFLKQEIEAGRISTVREQAQDLLRSSVKAWREFVFVACRLPGLEEVYPTIPHPRAPGNKLRLNPDAYFSVIAALVASGKFDHALAAIQTWGLQAKRSDTRETNGVIPPQPLVPMLQKAIAGASDDEALGHTLALVFDKLDDRASALNQYVLMKSNLIFDYINEKQIHRTIAGVGGGRSYITELLQIDEAKAIELFATHPDHVPTRIIRQTIGDPARLYRYYHALGTVNGTLLVPYADHVVELTAEYGAEDELMAFLQVRRADINLEKALTACRSHNLWECTRFVLLEMGRYQEALSVSLALMRSISRGLEIIDRSPDLKQTLMPVFLRIVNEAGLVGELLDAYPDREAGDLPLLQIVRDIDVDSKIDNLGSRLLDVLEHELLGLSRLQDCEVLFHADVFGVMRTLDKRRRTPIIVRNDTCCSCGCGCSLLGAAEEVVIFYCGHSFLIDCLRRLGEDGESPCPRCLRQR